MRQKPKVVVTGSVPRPYAGGSLDLSCKLDRTQETRNITWKRMSSELADNVRTRGNLIRYIPNRSTLFENANYILKEKIFSIFNLLATFSAFML